MITYTRAVLVQPFRAALGQVAQSFQVVVTDADGRPFGGAVVTINEPGGVSRPTDSKGIAAFDASEIARATVSGKVPVVVSGSGFSVKRDLPIDQTGFVAIPVCGPQPIISTPELIALVAGGALTGAGMYFKTGPLQVAGEVLFGAAIFTAVYRHSCGT